MLKTWFKRIWTDTDSAMAFSSEDKGQTDKVIEYSQDYLVNQKALDQIIKDTSIEIFPMLVSNFLEEISLRSDRIIQAMEIKDYSTLEFETHTLGSTSLAMGATALGLMARKMEKLCLKGTPESVLEHRDEFNVLTKGSKAAFTQILNEI